VIQLAYRAAYCLDGDSVAVALQLAEVYRATGNPQAGVSVCETMLLKYPQEPELFRRLGACYTDMNVPEAAQMCEHQVAALATSA
jgi:predicted Zn-dependent protease